MAADLAPVAVLFARSDSVYKRIAGCDVFDLDRDARTFSGRSPVVAHPPCRAWGRLRKFAKPRRDERDLALFAVQQVRENGGVLEHPAKSSLWAAAELPHPGCRDVFGGFTWPISQKWFGHRAEKLTYLYVVGIDPGDLPPVPLDLAAPSHVIARSRRPDGTRKHVGDSDYMPECTKAEREHTPPQLAAWLVDLARKAATHGR